MCQVVRLSVLVFFGVTVSQMSGAVTPSVSVETVVEKNQVASGTGGFSGEQSTFRTRQRVGMEVEGLWHVFTVSGGVSTEQPDYSAYLVQDSVGRELSLSDTVETGTEMVGDFNLDFGSGSHAAGLGLKSSLNRSPFFRRSYAAYYQHAFWNRSTVLGLRGVYLREEQPTDYFLDRDFLFKQRPETVFGHELALYGEQVLSERWKAGGEVSMSHRLEERPRAYGVRAQQAYALSDRFFGQMELVTFWEDSNQPLLNERGYFRLYQGELGLTYEPIYDLLVSASYALSVEREIDPRVRNGSTTVAADQYGLGVSKLLGRWELDLQGMYKVTNIQTESFSVNGGVKCYL